MKTHQRRKAMKRLVQKYGHAIHTVDSLLSNVSGDKLTDFDFGKLTEIELAPENFCYIYETYFHSEFEHVTAVGWGNIRKITSFERADIDLYIKMKTLSHSLFLPDDWLENPTRVRDLLLYVGNHGSNDFNKVD